MLRYIIYCRKSSEDEDRQVLSIESQLNELKRLADKSGLHVIDVLTEAKSAKSPGRPVFNEMLLRIKNGKAEGIICWKLDRLARNPLDGGQITWMIQKRLIEHIQTFDRSYYPDDNVLMMNMEFGMANQYILDLSKNVKRGLRAKVEKGWLPTTAPLGYLNDMSKEKGARIIIKDSESFDMVRRLWDLVLSGNNPPKILEIANNEWGFRFHNGKPLARATLYRMFTKPFYYGWFEYPMGSGNWHQGAHEPMITIEEFDKVQMLLGRKGNPRPKRYSFTFRGLIRCGECGGAVTAEAKDQIICSECKFKFSSKHSNECPKCLTPIEKMSNPKILGYVYHHCTKRIHPQCSQRYLEQQEMEKQIDFFLSKIHISERFKDWAIKHLKKTDVKEVSDREEITDSIRRSHDGCLKKLDNLFHLKISPLNSDGQLLSDEEYAKRKELLFSEKLRFEEALKKAGDRSGEWLACAEKDFHFAVHAKYWFAHGSPEEKERILRDLGSNLLLKDKKLLIQAKKIFLAIEKVVSGVPPVRGTFEPMKNGFTEAKLEAVYAQNPIVRKGLDEVRTYLLEQISGNNPVYHSTLAEKSLNTKVG